MNSSIGVDFEVADLLRTWTKDPRNIRAVFILLKQRLSSKENCTLSFNARPGISYSLRASINGPGGTGDRLFALIDVIDDDPANRWLSVCFYNGTVTDAQGIGNIIPQGIMGTDGYCFDLEEEDPAMVAYLNDRIDEAYENATAKFPSKSIIKFTQS